MLSVNLIFLDDIMPQLGNYFWGQHDENGVKSISFGRKWMCINNDKALSSNTWSCSQNLAIDYTVYNNKESINNQCNLLNNFRVLQAIRHAEGPLEIEILRGKKREVTIFLQSLLWHLTYS